MSSNRSRSSDLLVLWRRPIVDFLVNPHVRHAQLRETQVVQARHLEEHAEPEVWLAAAGAVQERPRRVVQLLGHATPGGADRPGVVEGREDKAEGRACRE